MVKFSKLVIPIFIIGLMIFSVIAYSLTFIGSTPPSQQTSTYKGTKFTYADNSWIAQIGNQRIEVFNNPLYLEIIELDSSIMQAILETSKIYLSSSPDEGLTEGTSFLRFTLNNDLGKQAISSCKEDKEGCENLPLKTCDDATKDAMVITLNKAAENSIDLTGNCISINGDSFYIGQVAEKIKLDALL